MVKSVLAQALALWNSPQFQELLVPVRTLSSISAMFWMLARLGTLFLATLKRLLPGWLSGLPGLLYGIALSAVYAAIMFNTALQGQWHPSLVWREAIGFAFMYVMLGVTFSGRSARRLMPLGTFSILIGVGTYLSLSMAPGLARQPALAEFHRVLELFAAGGWGNVMTVLMIALMLWSLLSWTVSEVSFSLSPLLHRMRLIKAPHMRLGGKGDKAGRPVVASLGRSWLMLSLLTAGICLAAYWWPKLRAASAAAAPAIQSRTQSPEAAAAAARLRRVLPAVSFTAVHALPREGYIAELARPVFRNLLSAPAAADRWLAAAALDRVDPGFRISPEELFRSTAAAALPCAWKGQAFQVLMLPLPGDDPAKTRTYWISDDRGVHFSGVGPGEFQEVSGSDTCALAAFGSAKGSVLLAFTEAAQTRGAPPHLWLAAYSPERREVIAAARVGENTSGNFALSATKNGVAWADAPASSATAACRRACGEVLGSPVLSLTTEPLVEYRSASVAGETVKIVPRSDQTFARSGLRRNYESLSAFELAFRFDPEAGFLDRWYRLARLADGRQCVSAALDQAFTGREQSDSWACDR